MNYKLTVIVPVYNQENLILRALYSIPNRKDVEVIIVNDGSTDNTHNKILEYINDNNLICTTNYCNLEINQGVSNAVNLGYEKAKGEYIVLLGSDDYFLPAIEVVIAHANGEDLVYFDLRINDGTVWHLAQETKVNYCGSVKLMRTEFIKGLKNNVNMKHGEDYYFFQEVLKRNPTEKFTNLVAKHYNFPRENSLSWKQRYHLD